jgi:SulP family sulfate permease
MSYSWNYAYKDFVAGLTVAAISLPQAMAYALIAGVDLKYGLYSAIVVTAVAAIFGSSNHLVNGPTNAISLVVFTALAFIESKNPLDTGEAMFLLGIMVGTVQILLAVFRLGDLTRYISESVINGFMAGASCLIALGQVGNFLGLHDQGTGHQHVLYRLWMTLTAGGSVSRPALIVGGASIVFVVVLRLVIQRFRLPQVEMLTSLIIASTGATYLGWTQPLANGKAILAVVGQVPASLPAFHVPSIQWEWISDLAGSSVAIAFLGLLEAFAIAKSIAHHTRQKMDYNQQCLAEGLANFTGGFFQCLPGSGSLTRSAINFQSGAATRFSGLFTATAVAIVLVLAAPMARFIPKAALAGLLLVTAVRLVDWKRLAYVLRSSQYDAALVIITAVSAILLNVEYSIFIGVGLSVALFVPRAAKLRATELVVANQGLVRERQASDPAPTDLLIYDLEGELFFGAAPELERYLEEITQRTTSTGIRYVILRFKRTRNPDVVFMERLEQFLRGSKANGLTVLLAGVRPDLAQCLTNLRFTDWLTKDQIFYEENVVFSATMKAVSRVYHLLGKPRPGAESPSEEFTYMV